MCVGASNAAVLSSSSHHDARGDLGTPPPPPSTEQALSVCLLFQSFLSHSFRERWGILVRTDFRTLRFHHKDVSGASEGN